MWIHAQMDVHDKMALSASRSNIVKAGLSVPCNPLYSVFISFVVRARGYDIYTCKKTRYGNHLVVDVYLCGHVHLGNWAHQRGLAEIYFNATDNTYVLKHAKLDKPLRHVLICSAPQRSHQNKYIHSCT